MYRPTVCKRERIYYKEKSEALLVVSMQTGPEGNVYKTKYIVMSLDQNWGEGTI